MTVLDEFPAAPVPVFVPFGVDEFGVLPAEPPAAGPRAALSARQVLGGAAVEASGRRSFADRRMQRAREQLPPVEKIRRLSIALCDRPYCLSPDEMTTLGDLFVYNDAHGS